MIGASGRSSVPQRRHADSKANSLVAPPCSSRRQEIMRSSALVVVAHQVHRKGRASAVVQMVASDDPAVDADPAQGNSAT